MTLRRPTLLTRRSRAAALAWTAALTLLAGTSACRPSGHETTEEPDRAPQLDESETVDTTQVCTDGCRRLERCAPELAQSKVEGDPTMLASRVAGGCDSACGEFDDQSSSLGLRDCLALSSCDAYWGCLSGASAKPWLAAVAPVGERSCENLCRQASDCAMTKLCEAEPRPSDDQGGGGQGWRARLKARGDEDEREARDEGRPREGEADDGQPDTAVDDDQASEVEPQCRASTRARRDELEETCKLQCESAPDDSRSRFELIGCLDHGSCGGMLQCLDGWTHADYSHDSHDPDQAPALSPGIDPVCDAFCTRAIVCGAEAEELELDASSLERLKTDLTSTYVECAVRCAKDQKSDAITAAYQACTAVESCDAFQTCSDEV